jgi:hypothetical protein
VAQPLGPQPPAGGARGAGELVGRHHRGDLPAGGDAAAAQLGLARGVVLQRAILGQRLDAARDLLADAPGDRAAVDAGVLDQVVQDGGRDGRFVGAGVVEQAGGDRRVLDVGGDVAAAVGAVRVERQRPRGRDELGAAGEGGQLAVAGGRGRAGGRGPAAIVPGAGRPPVTSR